MPEQLFHADTRAIVYGMQPVAVQRMLDFDFVCGRNRPSVGAIVEPTANDGYVQSAWGSRELLVPVYTSIANAISEQPDLDVVVNFASARSATAACREALAHEEIRTVATIAEGVPERHARSLAAAAAGHGVTLLGPSSIGGIKAGCFRVGNMGGAIDNIIRAKLYRPGSVAYVTRSGGLANELNHLLGELTDGVYEGIAIGGDRFPGSTFLDHLLRWEADPAVAVTVMIGELGGELELEVAEALESGMLRKPLVAWCLGTSAVLFPAGAQFGHAGASANAESETAAAKNRALAAAGASVPASFEGLAATIESVYRVLGGRRDPQPQAEVEPRPIPMDYSRALMEGLVRRPSNFLCTISDDRGPEVTYAGIPISEVAGRLGVGGTVGLLWLRRRLSEDASRFLELLLIVLASRDAAVAGTRATTIAVGAGKDLISAVAAGLLTIGPRFGGAIDASALAFADAVDRGLGPEAFVSEFEERRLRIPGIGYPTDDLTDTRARGEVIVETAQRLLPLTPVLDFATRVGEVTGRANARLILNVDGVVGAATADLLREAAGLSGPEAHEHLELGVCQGLFTIGRLIDFIGHAIDLRRLASVGFVATNEVLVPDVAELIAHNADGVRDSLVVGGSRFPQDTALDHVRRLDRDPHVAMTVVVDDGRVPLCDVCRAQAAGELQKPLVVWSGASCAHPAGSCLLGSPGGDEGELGRAIAETYRRLAAEGIVAGVSERQPEHGFDALYAGVPLHAIVAEGPDVGGVLGLLWFRRLLPAFARRFFEITLAVVADHGPAVSGAHSTIVASRAGKDLISSLVSGILTIGPRFGGAIDEAARDFKWAFDTRLTAEEFVAEKKRRGELVMGIGHRVRSVDDPDERVRLLRTFATEHFPSVEVLDYALAVERVTTAKRSSLILNVDGCIAACMIDLLRSCGCFTRTEADIYVDLGVMNGLFLLGRSIGMIGHHFDQRRLKQGLYRHPLDDIAYLTDPERPWEGVGAG